ncbi:type I restriction endonuclease subunit R [Fuchsiella alkaliacetigena]|uniref:type I restriction endonuclease subunit R n=1 Tax=Fuchsiella alkaliacetigena TaxID=957042 RepID=UPI002009E5A3|nr:type I restriction endonuclease [Fuchsiella alkaliacetigena]MCK8825505.1 type I restriction endonuclease [Fuchsiella alkaliacetigena]
MITPDILKEEKFQTVIKDHLTEENGYLASSNYNYDKHHALDKEMLFNFLETTQEKKMAKLQEIHGANYKQKIILRLNKELARRSMIDVIKHGIKDYGIKLDLAYFKPPTSFNQRLNKLYQQNIFSVIEELNYQDSKRIDLVIFLNGLPIIVFELKNPLTGQSYEKAIKQLRTTRKPNEKLFKFKQRAIVCFAMDTEEAYMTTRLNGADTFFLPFNKGHKGGAGNPPVEGKVRTHYIWEELLQKDSLLEILQKFIFIDVEEKTDQAGNVEKEEKLIFPRYHQLDAVRKVLADVKQKGTGERYLIQHSAGSGKTYSITWLAHRLSSLHNKNDQVIFDGVIVITDRLILDRQLQNSIYQIDHKIGMVAKIDKDSTQLADELNKGTKIIISTIQKFSYILDKVAGTKDKNYAIVIDEAHSGSTGKNMLSLKESLSLEEASRLDRQAEENTKDAEDKINEELAKVQDVQSISIFAFTATPKGSTLKLFGTTNQEGDPQAFHIYSMKQAIEEGFILDVLENYMTYKMYYKVNKQVKEDPEIKKRKGSKEIAKYVSLHPHNISQKTEIMIEHYRSSTRNKIGGEAKAMLVTSSRLHAVRYKLAFDKYIKENGYQGMKTLVAFSGTVKDDGLDYTENNMNEISSSIRKEFDKEEYRVLIVANKFQTGFDQPKLHTMFVDKKLNGLTAVQTLSRLNRTCSGKEDTFVLDFVNDPEDIKKAFEPYYEATTLKDDIDPNEIYTLQDEIMDSMLINKADIDKYVELYYKDNPGNDVAQRLNSLLDNSVERINELSREEKIDFRNKSKKFINLYMLILQIAPIKDEELHKLNIYLRSLVQKIDVEQTGSVDITDKVVLEYYKLEEMGKEDLSLEGDGSVGVVVSGGGAQNEEKERLSVIIEKLNQRFQTNFSESEEIAINQIINRLKNSEQLKIKAKANPQDDWRLVYEEEFDDAVVDSYAKNQEFYGRVLKNEEFRDKLMDLLSEDIYSSFRENEEA